MEKSHLAAIIIISALSATLTACGGDSPSLAEFAEFNEEANEQQDEITCENTVKSYSLIERGGVVGATPIGNVHFLMAQSDARADVTPLLINLAQADTTELVCENAKQCKAGETSISEVFAKDVVSLGWGFQPDEDHPIWDEACHDESNHDAAQIAADAAPCDLLTDSTKYHHLVEGTFEIQKTLTCVPK